MLGAVSPLHRDQDTLAHVIAKFVWLHLGGGPNQCGHEPD